MRYLSAAALMLVAAMAPVHVFSGLLARAAADEVKTPIGSMLLLNITAPRTPDRAAAFQQALRDTGPAPAVNPFVGEVQEDGSVKYGSVTVTVRNPCPPGTAHYEAPLPGRRSK
jgi:hypothetical protein